MFTRVIVFVCLLRYFCKKRRSIDVFMDKKTYEFSEYESKVMSMRWVIVC